MKQIKVVIVAFVVLILIGVISQLPKIIVLLKDLKKPYMYQAKVVATRGALIKLSNGKIVQLAGAYIPLGGINYREELLRDIQDLLVGKNVRVKILVPPKSDYPKYPLVIIYLDNNINLNETLIKEGNAFFDHGYYPGHEKYGRLEIESRLNKKGIWESKNPPKILFVANKVSMDIHLLDCPYFDKERKEETIQYYFIPQQIHYRKFYAFNCPYCRKDESYKEDFIDYYYDWHRELYRPN